MLALANDGLALQYAAEKLRHDQYREAMWAELRNNLPQRTAHSWPRSPSPT